MGGVEISVLKDGNLIQASGIARFTFIPTGREYLIYSLNEKIAQDGQELNKLYVGEINDTNAELTMIDQDDWAAIRNIMFELSKDSKTVPNNIQLSALTPKQYTVGPFKKIAVKDELMNGIIENQKANQPTGESEISTPQANQFIAPQEAETTTDTEPQTVVQDAFSMSAPVPEETAPTALVSEQPAYEQVPPTEMITQPTLSTEEPAVATPQVVPTATVQTVTVQTQPVTTTVPVEPQPVQTVQIDINQEVKDIINQTNGNADEIIRLFKENGLELVTPPVAQTVAEPVTNTVADPSETPAIDINNLPVASQPEVPVSEIEEESFVPTTPTLPEDDGSTLTETPIAEAPVSEPTVPVQQTQVVNTVVATPAVPVTEPTVPAASPIVETPVSEPTISVQQTVVAAPVAEPTVPAQPTQVVEPTVPVQTQVVNTVVATPTAPVAEPTVPVQQTVVAAPVAEPTVPAAQVVQTQIVAPPAPEKAPTASELTAEVNNSTVSFDIPDEPTVPVEQPSNSMGVPTIVPVTAEDMKPQIQTEAPTTVNAQPTAAAENDKTFIESAGPVVMPIGQEQTTAGGSPGDSGQN